MIRMLLGRKNQSLVHHHRHLPKHPDIKNERINTKFDFCFLFSRQITSNSSSTLSPSANRFNNDIVFDKRCIGRR
jgi:hypothetical protein